MKKVLLVLISILFLFILSGGSCLPQTGETPQPQSGDPKPSAPPDNLLVFASWKKQHTSVTVSWSVGNVEDSRKYENSSELGFRLIVADDGKPVEITVVALPVGYEVKCQILRKGKPVGPEANVVSSRLPRVYCIHYGD